MDKFGLFFKRFGRNAAGIVAAYGLQVGAEALMGAPVPDPFGPLVPVVIGPAINAAAKVIRQRLLDDEKAVNVVAKMF